MTYETILYSQRDGVAEIRLNRAHQLNAVTQQLYDELDDALGQAEADARSMPNEIRAAQVLDGVRGAAPVDKDALVALMPAISDLCTAFPEIAELDLNPVLAYSKGVGVLDARILLEGAEPTATGASRA
jgi:acetyltransferase